MFDRENYIYTLIESIKKYYQDVVNESIDIREKKFAHSEPLYIFVLPGFIATRSITKRMKEFLYAEYNIRGNIVKHTVGKLGVFAATHSFGLLAKQNLYIKRKNRNDSMFCICCNRTIRFFNFSKGYVDCYLKVGYSNEIFEKQLKFRESSTYQFVNHYIERGDKWYRESIMQGNALVRVTDEKKYLNGLEVALQYIKKISCGTESLKLFDIYINELFVLIKERVEHISCEFLSTYTSVFEAAYNSSTNDKFMIPVVFSHGDLQGGNIWLNTNGHITIYDWETNGIRSIWYDPATLYWNLHSSPFSINLFSKVKYDNAFLINDENKNYNDNERMQIAWILLLENVLFYLVDISQLPKDFQYRQLKLLTKNLEYRLGIIQNCNE